MKNIHRIINETINKSLKCILVNENHKYISYRNGQKYFHISQVPKEIPQEVWQTALEILKSQFPDYDYYNCIMYEPTHGIVRFDYSEDFDTCTEPAVDRRVTVDTINGTATEGKKDVTVWHGKGNFWVDDDYEGFDVPREKAWRQKYMDAIQHKTPKGKRAMPNGSSRAAWLNHLIDLDLIDEYFELNGITNPIDYLLNNETGKFKNVLKKKYEEYKENH